MHAARRAAARPGALRGRGAELGISEGEDPLLDKMLADGRIRRIGAVIRHRRLGYEANAMVVWDVPDSLVGEVGQGSPPTPPLPCATAGRARCPSGPTTSTACCTAGARACSTT